MAEIRLKTWDTEHFGIKIGEYIPDTGGDVGEDVARAGGEAYSLLVTRITADRIEIVNSLERNGFELKDTIVDYRVDLSRSEYFPALSGVDVREAGAEDVPAVREIAQNTFKDYIGHFHRDERLDRRKCDELYERWAVNSVADRNLADVVLLAEEGRRILGFGTIKVVTAHQAQGVLFGTAPLARRRGVHSTLIREAINWSKRRNLTEFLYGTQLDNFAAQSVLIGVGARTYQSSHTLHCWLGAPCE